MQALFNRLNSRLAGMAKGIYPLCASQAKTIALPNVPPTFSAVSNRCFGMLTSPINNTIINNFLRPLTPLVNTVCGMKVKGKAKLKCKHCYMVWRRGTLFVMCKERPSHKQKQRRVKPHNDWILTHATQCKVRPW